MASAFEYFEQSQAINLEESETLINSGQFSCQPGSVYYLQVCGEISSTESASSFRVNFNGRDVIIGSRKTYGADFVPLIRFVKITCGQNDTSANISLYAKGPSTAILQHTTIFCQLDGGAMSGGDDGGFGGMFLRRHENMRQPVSGIRTPEGPIR